MLEGLLEPHRALVEEETVVLGVPVAGYAHRGGLVEVVLDEILGALWLGIAEESRAGGVHAIVVVSLFLYVDDVVPVAVERCRLSRHDVAQEWHLPGLCHHRDGCHEERGKQ